MAMRTTTEVIEAARLGEPCTEEELRFCIVSMRTTMILAHQSHLRWSLDETLPAKIRLLSQQYWESINTYWNLPLDERLSPEDRPGHPEVLRRKKLAEAVWNKAQEVVNKKGRTK